MFELFFAMVKEEWRLHSTVFGSVSFALFPVLIFAISFLGTAALPQVLEAISLTALVGIVHAVFILLGIMVGGFGLLGREVMNRRFGQASLLAYSSRTLPVSERAILADFIIKDLVYYFILWILPFGAGALAASPIAGVGITRSLTLLLTLTLSFLTGFAAVFLLSTIYARSRRLLAVVIVIGLALFAAVWQVFGADLWGLFPPIAFFSGYSPTDLVFSLVLILIPMAVALAFMTTEFSEAEKRFENAISPLARRLDALPHPELAAKDLLDLWRSGSGVGQAIFSFIFPLALIWFALLVLGNFITGQAVLMLYAILVGVISSTMYNWLTEFDIYCSYAFLPLDVTTVLQSKIRTFMLLQAVPVVFMAVITLVSGLPALLLPALILSCSVSFYALSVVILLCGLSPGVLIYDVKVLALYLLALGPVLLVLVLISFLNPLFAAGSIVLAVPSWLLIRRGVRRWGGEKGMDC